MGVYSQPLRNPLDIINRNIAFTAFNPAEIRPVHLDVVGKILLAHAKRLPVAPDIRSYDRAQASGVSAFHPSWFTRKMVIRRRVLSINSLADSHWGLAA